MDNNVRRKNTGKAAFYVEPKRVALLKDENIIKIFPSLNVASKKLDIDLSILSKEFKYKRQFSFLHKNEKLKIITEKEYIKHEIILFKRHISYLKKNHKLVFNCTSCLRLKGETLPLSTFTVFGRCTKCNINDDVSCSSINYWLIKNNYNLLLTDRSKFLRVLVPFEFAEKPIYLIEKELGNELDPGNPVINTIQTESNEIKPKREIPIEKIVLRKKANKSLLWRFSKNVGVVAICAIILYLIIISEEKYRIESNKVHTVKAILLEKNSDSNIIIYKNVEGNIFKIPNALRFWDCGKVNDSILVSFANEYNPVFVEVKPLK